MSIPPSPHPPISQTTISIAGLRCTVHGLAELPATATASNSDSGSSGGGTRVACLWLLHPRLASRESMTPLATTLIREWNAHAARLAAAAEKQQQQQQQQQTSTNAGGNEHLGLIAVAVDHRNHGSRVYDAGANLTWLDGNEAHALDMFMIYSGTTQDIMQLRPILESYLFPQHHLSQRHITTHLALGVSLGGHAAWQLLLHDPAIHAAIVVVGSPDYASLMQDRARRTGRTSYTASNPPGAAFVGSVDFSNGLVELVERWDPRGVFLGVRTASGDAAEKEDEKKRGWSGEEKARFVQMLAGKRLLNLVGVEDKLVPYAVSRPFLSWMNGTMVPELRAAGLDFRFNELLEEGVGHEMTSSMVDASVAFIINVLEEQVQMAASAQV